MPKFVRHISESALQFGINQTAGLGLFYLLSRGLDKDRFGELNWALAVSLTAFSLLGLGLDQLTVKKIAGGDAPSRILAVYRAHVRWSGSIFYGLLLLAAACFPSFFSRHYFLLGVALAKTLLFFSMPYKQLAAGREQFGILMKMSVCSSLLKFAAVLVCFFAGIWSIQAVLGLFIAGDLAEWVLSNVLGRRLLAAGGAGIQKDARQLHVPAPARSGDLSLPNVTLEAWKTLIRESLPQAGVVLFSSAIARFDWIFIGLFVSSQKLAEYSFAYKGFEVASLPMLVIAPLLIPFFTRTLQKAKGAFTERMGDLQYLLKGEILIGWAIVVCMNLAWSPIGDAITSGKYGQVNVRTIFLLSLCLPLLYLNNFLWTIHFAHGRLHWIFRAFAAAFALNVAGDIILIPLYGNEGAALAFLLAILLQTLLYHKGITEVSLSRAWTTFGLGAAGAALAGLGAAGLGAWLGPMGVITGTLFRCMSASVLFILLLVITAELRPGDIRFLRSKLS